jgi:acetyl esterase/lipase
VNLYVDALQGYGVSRPVAGIFNMYGPCDFANDCWTQKITHMKLPGHLTSDFINKIYDESPVPIEGGVSLEGQANGPPDFSDPRQAFALSQVANGTVMDAVYPSRDWADVDPLLNISSDFPPTYIVHGTADTKVPIKLSRKLYQRLQSLSITCGMSDAPGEEHTFAAKMEIGSPTWDIQRRGFDFLQGLL